MSLRARTRGATVNRGGARGRGAAAGGCRRTVFQVREPHVAAVGAEMSTPEDRMLKKAYRKNRYATRFGTCGRHRRPVLEHLKDDAALVWGWLEWGGAAI